MDNALLRAALSADQLSGELIGRPGVRFPGEHRDLFRRAATVRFADTVPVSGLADPDVLRGLSGVATEFPDPDQ